MVKLKDIKVIIAKRTFIVAFFLAISLWAYASLNETYNTNVEVPLTVIIPENRAVERALPEHIAIEVRGTGWNLVTSFFFNRNKECVIDLSDVDIRDSVYDITRSDILKGIRAMTEVNPSEVFEKNIKLYTGSILERKVPIENAGSITPYDGFIVVGKPILVPDSVVIRGNEKLIKNIKSWKTSEFSFMNVSSNFQTQIQLNPSEKGLIELVDNSVTLIAEIQQEADKVFSDLKVSPLSMNIPSSYQVKPELFNVVISGGVDELLKVQRSDIKISLSNEANASTGIVVPKVQLPKNIKLKSIEPNYVFVSKKVYNIDLSVISN